jgi:hypothetical protein|tara:strand:- start:1724 stop:3457 length:1734 start_codon:yes stop_codon:yes gene_type:complete
MGTANQVYRTASKVTPVYHKAGLALRNDFNSLCLGDGTPDVPMVDCAKKPAKYDYMIDIRGFVKLVNTGTGKCLQPKDYKLGTSLTEKTCSQLDYQWWELIHVPGGWSIKNAQTKNCDKAGQKAGDAATQDICASWSQAILAPLNDPKSGVLFKDIKSAALPKGKFANINVSPAEREPTYNFVLQQTLAVKKNRLKIKLNPLQDELNDKKTVRYKSCSAPPNPAYWPYQNKYAQLLVDMKEGRTKCVKPPSPVVVTHLDCPPAAQKTPPPEKARICGPNYDIYGGKAIFEAARKKYPTWKYDTLCQTKDNPAYQPWVKKYWPVWEKMQRGKTCGPNGTAITTTGGFPKGKAPWNACPPPAPPKTLAQKCEWRTGWLPKDQRAAVQAQANALQTTITEYRKEIRNGRIKPPVEPAQYLCRASHKTSSKGFTVDDLLIGIVRNNKCVFATNIQEFASSKVVEAADYELLSTIEGVSWLANRGSVLHRTIPLGYRSTGASAADTGSKAYKSPLRSIYACRTVDQQTGKSTIGWSKAGTDCTFPSNGKVITMVTGGGLDLLVRDADKQLNVDTSVDENKKK